VQVREHGREAPISIHDRWCRVHHCDVAIGESLGNFHLKRVIITYAHAYYLAVVLVQRRMLAYVPSGGATAEEFVTWAAVGMDERLKRLVKPH